MFTRLALLACIGLITVVASPGNVLRANGTEFFDAENDGQVFLYYFGHVRDTRGQIVDKFMVTIRDKAAGLTFPFRNDTPGHFRSPDVGRAIKGAGKPVDPRTIEVTISKAGYRIIRAPRVPDKQGAVELENFVVEAIK